MIVRTLVTVMMLGSLGGTLAGQTTGGTLVLHNAQWDSVRVEARLGLSPECEANPVVAVRTLRRGQRWAFVSGDVLCWRRERRPGDANQGWTDWERLLSLPATRNEVEL